MTPTEKEPVGDLPPTSPAEPEDRRHVDPRLGVKIRYAARTDVGMKRDHNEDFFAVLDDDLLFVVADGMGGHAAGEVASQMAVDVMAEFFTRSRDDDATWPYKLSPKLSYPENRLVCGIRAANYRIYDTARSNISRKGMGTTIVAAHLAGDGMHIAHVGDSRAYLARGESIRQLTRDHSLLEDYREAKPDLTAEEEANFPHKNVITRALGMRDEVEVAVRSEAIEEGDTFLLCCDGLSGMVADPAMLAIIRQAGDDLEQATAALIEAANQAGGVDNITAILLRCQLRA